jgi:opacity protein-like surface antigen
MSIRKLMLAAVLAFGAMQSALAADVTGTWAMTTDVQGTTGNPSFVLKQDGETVTGSYKGQLGEAPVTGTIKGNELVLNYKVSAQGTDLEVKYTGTVDGKNITGKLSLGELGEGTFKGTKQ